jgi:hypothetical protein
MTETKKNYYRFTGRLAANDFTTDVLAREATGDEPEARLPYDPQGFKPPVALSDDEVARVRRFVELTQVKEDGSSITGELAAGSQIEPPPNPAALEVSRRADRLEALSASDVKEIAAVVFDEETAKKTKGDLVELLKVQPEADSLIDEKAQG